MLPSESSPIELLAQEWLVGEKTRHSSSNPQRCITPTMLNSCPAEALGYHGGKPQRGAARE